MRRDLLLSILISLSIPLLGNPVDETTAKQLAQNFWKENNIMSVKGNKVFKRRMDDANFVNVAPQCGYSEFFIFNNEDGKGFVIIAADDCVTPILGYSYDNNFITENLPSNLKEWLDGYAEQIRMAVEMRVIATDEIRADWKCLRQGKNLPIKSETQVYPLIATTWNQGYPYNELCPTDYGGPGNHAYAGCVATAMAQIMKYWSFPNQGFGFHQYNHPLYGQLSANFGETTYNWSVMPNNSSNNAVAKLLYHCGVSVEMNYGPNASGAQTIGSFPSAEQAYKTFFDYKSTLHSISKSDYSDSEWISILKAELNAVRPIHYRGQNTDGGHSFICDGYNNSNQFHFNWGWSGNNDGYYNISTILFPINQQAIIGIEPNNTTYNFDLVYYSTPIMSEDEYWFFDDLSVYAEVWNIGSGAFNGYIGAGVYYEEDPGSGTYYFLEIMDYWNRTSNPLPGTYYVYGDLDCTGGPPYIPGSYAIAMLYSMDGDLWNFIDLGSYDYAYFDIVSSYTINTYSNFSILTNNGVLYQNTDATINVDLINAGSETFYGNFRINLANTDGSWVQNLGIIECNNGLPVNYHYTNGLDFTGTITAPSGTYLMELAYQYAGSSNWYYAGASDYQNPVWVYVAPEPVYADPYEPNNSQNLAYSFTPSFSGSSATVNTTGSNLHNSSDVDYYKINLNSGYDYTITPILHDAFWNGNGNTYSVEALFAYSTDGVNWSNFYYADLAGNIIIEDGGTVYFDVIPYYEGNIGTYLLSNGITRTQHTNNYTISVSASPSNGGSVTGGDTYNQGQTCTVSATANSGYTFVNWTENGAQVSTNANYSFTVNGNRNLVANFQAQPQQYTINVSASPSYGGSVTGGGAYNQGQSCTVTASANSGYTFINWTENGAQVSTNANYTFTVTGNRNLVAHFTTQNYVITALADPTAGGTVTGSGGYNYGDNCTLSATANTGYTFINWTKNGTQVSTNPTYTFTVTETATYIAHFSALNYTVTTASSPSDGGTTAGGGTYNHGETCTVTASAANGYTFTNWTENGTQVSTNANYSFTVTGNRNLVANFAQNTHTIQASAGTNGFITPSGTVTVTHGANQTFAMIPNEGYEVQDVYIDGMPVGPMTSYTFSNVTADHYIHVTFVHVDGLGENNMEVVLYPNPANSSITITGKDLKTVEVYNTIGQKVATTQGKGDTMQIDIANLPAGIYFVNVTDAEGRKCVKRVVKE